MPIIRDLVCDMKPFWDKHLAVKPWLQNKQPVPPPNEEYRVSNASDGRADSGSKLHQLRRLFDGLRVVRRQPGFLGSPSARTGLRYAGDPRDAETKERLAEYSKPGGIWDARIATNA